MLVGIQVVTDLVGPVADLATVGVVTLDPSDAVEP
jgi:hypothetical protein